MSGNLRLTNLSSHHINDLGSNHFPAINLQGLLPIERVISMDFPSGHGLPGYRKLVGAQGTIPAKAGHYEAVVLPSVRVGENFVWRNWARVSVLRQASGTGALRNVSERFGIRGYSRRCCPALAGMPPWACADEYSGRPS
jgi:hypothetical protein